MTHGLGRLHRPDTRDAAFPMRALLGAAPKVTRKIWQTGPVLDQGQTPHCVGYAGAQWLMTQENAWDEHPLPPGVSGDVLYYRCKVVDGEPKQEDGSSGRSLMQVFQAMGYLQSYHWATSVNDIIDWVATKGPVLCGTPWMNDMFTPDKSGYLHPSGGEAGGHEWLAHGVFPGKRGAATFEMVNSWNASWGVQGHAFITAADLWKLIKIGGDAVGALRTEKMTVRHGVNLPKVA